MRDHVKILGILNIVMGGLTVLVGALGLLFLGGIAGGIAAAMHSGAEVDGGEIAAPILGLVGLCIAGFFLCLGLPSLIGGWGLMNFKPWSRPLMIVVSGFHLLHVPLGTALGIYGLWVLLNEGTQPLLGAPPRQRIAA